MDGDGKTIELGVQLAVAGGLVLVMTIVHGLGLVMITKLLRLDEERLKEHRFNVRAVVLMGAVAFLLFVLHIAEIWFFAAFYMTVGIIGDLGEALNYSASAYATLGRTIENFPDDWQLIGALEALIGFVLISWSTAFLVSIVNKLRS